MQINCFPLMYCLRFLHSQSQETNKHSFFFQSRIHNSLISCCIVLADTTEGMFNNSQKSRYSRTFNVRLTKLTLYYGVRERPIKYDF